MRVLRRGSKGNEVKILQDLLGISVDGSFGPQTDREVRAYQKSKGLVVDGSVGPATWSSLNKNVEGGAMRTLRRGSKGEDVKILQKELGILTDGSFGPATDKAVRNYQRTNGLAVDGSVGPATWGKLLGGEKPTVGNRYFTQGYARVIACKPEDVSLIVANKKYNQVTSSNITNGTFFWAGKPNGILINNGKTLWNDASHAWRGYGQGVLYFDGKTLGVKKVKSA